MLAQRITEGECLEKSKAKMAELMQLVYLFIALSFIVKSLYFKMDLSQCTTEYVILIGTPIYQMVRSRQLAVVLNANMKEQMLNPKRNMISIIIAVALFFFFWLSSGNSITLEFAAGQIITFIVVFILTRFVFVRLEEKRRVKLEKEYED